MSPSLAHINIFTPKPGLMEEFIAVQLKGLPALTVPGSQGSRLYRAKDDKRAILIAFFEDEAAHRKFLETPAFQRHRERLLPLLENATPGYFTLAYSRDSAPEEMELSAAIGL
ncbi:MAG TPA: antibiotic biosynthesis monooxygenase family protein [Rhizomicrobium sp.]|nr:antibiotic biosynthesis monooxygenase family protein [Rhizomicrobium sp.]